MICGLTCACPSLLPPTPHRSLPAVTMAQIMCSGCGRQWPSNFRGCPLCLEPLRAWQDGNASRTAPPGASTGTYHQGYYGDQALTYGIPDDVDPHAMAVGLAHFGIGIMRTRRPMDSIPFRTGPRQTQQTGATVNGFSSDRFDQTGGYQTTSSTK
jgi:hypothetical protein